ncbi:MAG: DUF2878 domain-containing protein [Thiobacillaceae bacterium]
MTARDSRSGWRMILPNFLFFQIGWFAAVLGAANGFAWLGPVVIGIILLVHLRGAPQPRKELQLISIVLLTGLLFESLPAMLGWVRYQGHLAATAPLWMIALWGNFATTLNISLRALRPHSALLAMLGFIGGPAAYWGGVSLGALSCMEFWPVLIYLALGWAALTPVLGRLALRLDGFRHGV